MEPGRRLCRPGLPCLLGYSYRAFPVPVSARLPASGSRHCRPLFGLPCLLGYSYRAFPVPVSAQLPASGCGHCPPDRSAHIDQVKLPGAPGFPISQAGSVWKPALPAAIWLAVPSGYSYRAFPAPVSAQLPASGSRHCPPLFGLPCLPGYSYRAFSAPICTRLPASGSRHCRPDKKTLHPSILWDEAFKSSTVPPGLRDKKPRLSFPLNAGRRPALLQAGGSGVVFASSAPAGLSAHSRRSL